MMEENVEPVADEPVPESAPTPQGAQVVLTGDAQAAARGETHSEIAHNTAARDAAMSAPEAEEQRWEAVFGTPDAAPEPDAAA